MAKTAYKKIGAAGWSDHEENLGKLAARGNPLQCLNELIGFELFRDELERGMLNTSKTAGLDRSRWIR